MFVADRFFFDGKRSYIEKIKKDYYAEQALEEAEQKRALERLLPPKVVFPEDGADYFESASIEEEESATKEPVTEEAESEPPVIERKLLVDELSSSTGFKIPQPDQLLQAEGGERKDIVTPQEVLVKEDVLEPEEEIVEIIIPEIKPPAPAHKSVVASIPSGAERIKIALVLDDMGMNLTQSKAALTLPASVTFAFLPYAPQVKNLSSKAHSKGHETILHMPMEAMDGGADLGGTALQSGMDKQAFDKTFNQLASSFDGYVGVNNHMGSRLTQDRQAMNVFMAELKRRNLFFLDSRTIHTTIASEVASIHGVPHAERKVFLDHKETPEFVRNSFARLEDIARREGSAVAIGHPKAVTIEALKEWIPTLEAKGIELVPLSQVMVKTAKRKVQKKTPKEEIVRIEIPPQQTEQTEQVEIAPEESPVNLLVSNQDVVVTPPPVFLTEDRSSFSAQRIYSQIESPLPPPE